MNVIMQIGLPLGGRGRKRIVTNGQLLFRERKHINAEFMLHSITTFEI